MRTPSLGARAFIPVALAGAIVLAAAPSSPAAAAEPTEAQQIIKIAKAQTGDPWRFGADGPRSFDCSGLAIYAFKKAGDAKAVGSGKYRTARSLYRWYKSRGLANRSNPKPGDLVIWGGGSHIGIYIGGGKAISTLTNGVRVHGVHALRTSFTAYLHTGMWKKTAGGSTIATASTSKSRATIAIGDVRHTVGSVNFRKGPGINHARTRVLRNNAKLVVVGKGQDSRGRWWLKVEAGSRTGWVAKWLTD